MINTKICILLMLLIIIIIKFNQSLNIVQTLNIKENFEINNITVRSPKLASTINFINIDDGCNILKSSKYFSNLNKQDKIKRNLSNKNTKQILSYYCQNILEFSQSEKEAVNWLVNLIITHPNLEYQEIIMGNWNFIKVQKIENNFPHTHKNAIVMPSNIINIIIVLHKKFKNIDKRKINLNHIDSYQLKDIITLMIHEKVHIHQRINPDFYSKLYKDWNFKKTNIKDFNRYVNNSRSNPDGDLNNWVIKLKDEYLTLIALYNQDSNNISSVDYLGIYLEPLYSDTYDYQVFIDKSGNIMKKKLLDIKEFEKFFNINNNHYHPNEISAELISHYYVSKMGYNLDIDNHSPAMTLVKNNISQL